MEEVVEEPSPCTYTSNTKFKQRNQDTRPRGFEYGGWTIVRSHRT